MHIFYRGWLLLGWLLSWGATIEGQAQPGPADVVVVSPLVGPTISHNEYQRYGLSAELDLAGSAVDSLRVIPLDDGSFLGFFYLSEGGTEGQPLSREAVAALRDVIQRRGRLLWQRYRSLRAQVSEQSGLQATLTFWDARQVEGEIGAITDLGLILINAAGQQEVRLEDLAAIELRSDRVQADLPQSLRQNRLMGSHYTFMPSAIPLERGEHYFQNIGVSLNTVNFTPLRGLTLSAGTELSSLLLLPLLTGEFILPLYARASLGYRLKDQWYVGAGITSFNLIGFRDQSLAGIGYVMGTYRGKNLELTASAGWGAVLDPGNRLGRGLRLARNPTFTLSGRWRITDDLSFITENWYIRSGGASLTGAGPLSLFLFSVGPRLELNRVAIDLTGIFLGTYETRLMPGGRRSSSLLILPIPLPLLGGSYFF